MTPPPGAGRPGPHAITYDHRLNIYLGGIADLHLGHFNVSDRTRAVILNTFMTEAEFVDSLPTYPFGRELLKEHDRARLAWLWKNYLFPVVELFQAQKLPRTFLVVAGDNVAPLPWPSFTKSRPITGAANGVILPLNVGRHFGLVAEVDRHDIPFAEKDDKLVWRGATTGRFKFIAGRADVSSRYHIMDLPQRAEWDVGYSEVVQIDVIGSARPVEEVRTFIRPPLTMKDQLRSRFLLCLEGNDVASGLKWMLRSNSVVIMPRPNYETWACERLLGPYVHFVPVRPDLADLEDVYEWCLSNRAKCEEIARNGRSFIANFMDPENEMKLRLNVARAYAHRVRLRPAATGCEAADLVTAVLPPQPGAA